MSVCYMVFSSTFLVTAMLRDIVELQNVMSEST